MSQPLVTIGVISCNRYHYFKALMESAVQCIDYENIEWIVIDNASIEPGLIEYIKSLDFVNHKIFREKRSPSTEHIEAMNQIVKMAKGKYLMLLPEDLQFIMKGKWLADLVEVEEKNKNIGTICFDAQRRITINKIFKSKLNRFIYWKNPPGKIYKTSTKKEFISYGAAKPGISGAGIMSFTHKYKWLQLGEWKSTGKQTVGDSSGGGETEMLDRYKKMGLNWERVITRIPIALAIVNDPRGTKARIRGNRRYGIYSPPPKGNLYYKIWEENEVKNILKNKISIPFEKIAIPLGFKLPFDKKGNLLKNPHVNENEKFEWIHPSVVGIDI